ncbi:MAG: iron transporter substrate-binding protein [Dehalococcoidia bacterium]|nr:iron transporter substrate-binding protein [Dehalococcoidia bacterium]
MKRIGYGMAVLVVVFGLLIAACAAPSPTPTPAPAPTPQGPTTGTAPAAPAAASEQQLIEAAKKEGGTVVFWTHSLDEPAKVFVPFERKYPFLKVEYWDAPGGSDAVIKILLANNAVPAYTWDNVVGWENQPTGQDFYRNIGMSLRAPMYNTDLVKEVDAPHAWEDLANTKWAGKSLMSTSGDEVPLLFAYYWREGDKLNWDKSFKFWTDVVAKTKPRAQRGFTAPTQFLVAGDVSIFLVNSLNTGIRNMVLGAPIDIAPVPFVVGSPWSISLVKDAPHPASAKLLVNWLTGEGMQHYSDLQQVSALNPKVYAKQYAGGLLAKKGIKVFYTPSSLYTAENNKISGDFWFKLLSVR